MSRTASYERQRNPHATQRLARTTATHEPIRNPHAKQRLTRTTATHEPIRNPNAASHRSHATKHPTRCTAQKKANLLSMKLGWLFLSAIPVTRTATGARGLSLGYRGAEIC